jgi:hypothetical protein
VERMLVFVDCEEDRIHCTNITTPARGGIGVADLAGGRSVAERQLLHRPTVPIGIAEEDE